MSKVLLINGSPNEHGCTYTALCEVAASLEKNGIETEILYLGKAPVPGCIACGRCRRDGLCSFGGQVNDIIKRIEEFDGLIVGSPVYYAAASGQITSFMDRLFYAAGRKMRGKVGAAVVSCRRGGAYAAFDQLNKYFSISQMPIATSVYWNQVHGNTPEQVCEDNEGLQTMRYLGENMAWLIKCIQAGKAAGVAEPEQEKRVTTNFIR